MAESLPPAPGRIFISYRRDESAYPAGWLFDRLAERFGFDQVFKDVDSIEMGDDFVEVITNAVGSTDVLLALIGDRWLTITDEHGKRRLDDPNDFVRLEIEAALARKVRVIPILVEGANMPRADELPPSLAALARRQALELSPSRFDFDTSRLLRVLDKTLAEVRAAEGDVALGAPATKARGRSVTEVQKALTQRDPGSRGRTPDATPGAPAAPGWRRRFSARPRLLIGIGVALAAVVISLLIAVFVANSNNTDPNEATAGIYTSTEGGYPACEEPSGDGWQAIELGDNPTGTVELTNGSFTRTVTQAHWRALEGPSTWLVSLDTETTNNTPTDFGNGSYTYAHLIVDGHAFVLDDGCYSTDTAFVESDLTGGARAGFKVSCKPVGAIQLVIQDPDRQAGEDATIYVTSDTERGPCIRD
jgi:TIR domain